MIVTTTKEELQEFINSSRKEGYTIGFVPTMGALHKGHLSLINEALGKYDLCVASVFVNPKQFNNPQDLETYPRQPKEDIALLEQAGCHCLFMPSVNEMYGNTKEERTFAFGSIGKVMEGTQRPGHFEGVALVVSKLFDIVTPDGAFFGEKDFQQIAIIRSMVAQCNYDIKIHSTPIIREKSGLALSSRNQRLTKETRPSAPYIYQILQESRGLKEEGKSPAEVMNWVEKKLNGIPFLKVEYYSIVDTNTLLPINSWNETLNSIGCIACYCGEVRLIDNIRY